MCTVIAPANMDEALKVLESVLGFIADADLAQMPAESVADCLRRLEGAGSVEAAARGRLLVAFDAKDGHLGDGQRTSRAWFVHSTRVTRRQAGEYKALQTLAREHQPLLAGLRAKAVTKSLALQLARWTKPIPAEYREQAEEILIAAARAGAGQRGASQTAIGRTICQRSAVKSGGAVCLLAEDIGVLFGFGGDSLRKPAD